LNQNIFFLIGYNTLIGFFGSGKTGRLLLLPKQKVCQKTGTIEFLRDFGQMKFDTDRNKKNAISTGYPMIIIRSRVKPKRHNSDIVVQAT